MPNIPWSVARWGLIGFTSITLNQYRCMCMDMTQGPMHPVARCTCMSRGWLVHRTCTAVHVQRHTMYVVCMYVVSRMASMCGWLQRMTVTQLCLACTQQKCMADAASACVHVRHKSTSVLVSALSSPTYQDCWLWTNPADTEEQGQHSHKRW